MSDNIQAAFTKPTPRPSEQLRPDQRTAIALGLRAVSASQVIPPPSNSWRRRSR
jgi:hypothetical protein